MRYVIECHGTLLGPFATDREASEWALAHLVAPWRLRSIHVIPDKPINDDQGDD